MENPSSTHSCKSESIRRRKTTGECIAPWQFRKGFQIRNPCEISHGCDTIHVAFDFLTSFVIFFGFLPNLSPCNSYCFGLFSILYWGLAIKATKQDIVKRLFHLLQTFGGKLSAPPALSHFLSFSFHFLTTQTTFEDDNSEDEQLETFPP